MDQDQLYQLWSQLSPQDQQRLMKDYDAEQVPLAMQLKQAEALRGAPMVQGGSVFGTMLGGLSNALRGYKANQLTQDAMAKMQVARGQQAQQPGLWIDARHKLENEQRAQDEERQNAASLMQPAPPMESEAPPFAMGSPGMRLAALLRGRQ